MKRDNKRQSLKKWNHTRNGRSSLNREESNRPKANATPRQKNWNSDRSANV